MGLRPRATLAVPGLIAALATVPADSLAVEHGTAPADADPWRYRGVAITAYWHEALDNPYLERQLDYFVRIGANAVELVPNGYQAHAASDEIHWPGTRGSEPAPWQQKLIPDSDLVRAISLARAKGLEVNLKPHLEPYPEQIPRLSDADRTAIEQELDGQPDQQSLFRRCYWGGDDGVAPGRLNTKLSAHQLAECRAIIEDVLPALFWRARIAPRDPDAWFESYRAFLAHYLDIALRNDVALFTVGTEMVCMTRPEQVARWSRLMEHLHRQRARFHARAGGRGPLRPLFTYAAHENEIIGTPNDEERDTGDYALNCGEDWGQSRAGQPTHHPMERRTVLEPGLRGAAAKPDDIAAYRRFWRLFDVVSLTAYFKLGRPWPHELEDALRDGSHDADSLKDLTGASLEDERDARTSSLGQRWRAKVHELARWREIVAPGKPVVLAELGYRSVDFGHHKPYQSAGAIFPDLIADPRYNAGNQRRAYEAAFGALSEVPWVQGVFLWQEEIQMPPAYARRDDASYSLIGKPAAAAVERAYTGRAATQWDREPGCHALTFDRLDSYDLDTGGGTTLTRPDDESSFAWVKARLRPWSICSGGAVVDQVQLGLWASGAWGDGLDAPSGSTYGWERALAGVTAKLLGRGLTWDLDLGLGNLSNWSSSNGGRFRSRQNDEVFSLFTHLEWRRRDHQHRWWPKTEVDFEGIWSLDAHERRTWEGQALEPDPLDRDRMEAVLSQGIVDQPLPGGALRLTPALTLGHVWQDLAPDYAKAGVGVTLGRNSRGDNTDLATLRFQYADQKAGIWEATLWLDLLEIGATAMRR